MYALLLIITLSSCLVLADTETELSGNLEAQGRRTWNNPNANDFPLTEDWDSANFYLFYGNVNGKVDFENNRVEANWFARHSQSALYESDYLATRSFTFPNKLVARDLFRANYQKKGDRSLTESVLNKFYYEREFEQNRIMLGRMYINYGIGEIFNPVNPFNQPTALTSISQVAQGNDGGNFTYFFSDDHRIDFYALGDKSLDNYSGHIDPTYWVHGEKQATDDFQVDYVFGFDQRRQKFGGQLRYNLSEAMIFAQALYQSEFKDQRDEQKSHSLVDAMFGYDQQMTNKYHLRIEGGYQQKNRYAVLNSISVRFLPIEQFIAFSNQYEVHPLVKLTGTIIFDPKSRFTYFVTKNTLDLGHSMEAEIFAFIPLNTGDASNERDNLAQNLVTTDVGLAVRAFF